MSSKTKKGKKKSKTGSDVPKNKDASTNKKIFTYFSNDEINEIKSIMKVKDVTGVPFVIAATILYKFDILKQILKDGYNINQTGQNNMTALMWAVKYKYVDIVDYLLNNGADPTIKTDSGDNVLILALEHKLWDEQSMINLWKAVKRVSFIDVNFTNKNGHNMLHMCVRRDWEDLLKLLLTEKPNIDSGNSNGVTPLMLACFRNNINIIKILIDAGADIFKEDNHGRMTLCYAISSSGKISKPTFLATEKIIVELRQKSLLHKYLKRRLELIITTAKKNDISCATSEMLIKIIQFAVQSIKEGICIFLECGVFAQVLEILETRLENASIVKFLLEVCEEMLFYNEQSIGYKPELYAKMLEDFYKSGCVEMALEIVREESEEAKIAFNLIVLGFVNDERWEKILEENSNLILGHLNENQTLTQDETQAKILKNKKRKLKKAFDNLDLPPPSSDSMVKIDDRKKSDSSVNHSKKSRRRSKAMKAKLSKIKSAELSKRLNLNGKNLKPTKPPKMQPTKSESSEEIEFLLKPEEIFHDNPIAASFQHLLNNEIDNCDQRSDREVYPKWKKQIASMSRVDVCKGLPIDQERLSHCIDHLKDCAANRKFDPTIGASLNIVVDYLRQLVQMIVRKYREHWENDRTTGNCNCTEITEHVPWLFNRHLKTREAREKLVIKELQKHFDQLLKAIKDLVHKDPTRCLLSVFKLESTILNYEIRGIKVLSYVCGMENFTMRYATTDTNFDDDSVVEYVQNVVNDVEDPRPDVEIDVSDDVDDASFTETYKSETPVELYYREMSLLGEKAPRNKRNETEAKLNTVANGFHLINSIMSICDELDDDHSYQKYGPSDLNHPLRIKYHKPPRNSEISEYMPKRLKSQISSLQNQKTFQQLLGGEIRLASKEKRLNYIISAGINFSAAELGLDLNDQPLAVKKIPRESWVGKILKTLVDPLMGLVDNHILHYFACEYEGNELILATPLCKWTLTQYVQLLHRSTEMTVPAMSAVQMVKQFFHGLMVLHKCDIPIVHGNLKPSNVFIDFNGLVKIAEFGIHKALYKIIEAPKSSLIWFAKETLDIYRNSSIVECSLKSDVQVAGMLMYFLLTCGKHPFGEEVDEIIKNIHRGAPKLSVRSLDLRDLLLWMLHSDFNERPSVEQVLSHTFFWSRSKKWNFVLCCSGVNPAGYVMPINVEKLHRSIDTFCAAYINIDWHEVIGNKFPALRITENNNLVGLLKFIKNCHDHQVDTNISDAEISCAVLSLFPTLPVALYRTLQNTNWLKNAVFMPFSELF